jgi:hypothetical protein
MQLVSDPGNQTIMPSSTSHSIVTVLVIAFQLRRLPPRAVDRLAGLILKCQHPDDYINTRVPPSTMLFVRRSYLCADSSRNQLRRAFL